MISSQDPQLNYICKDPLPKVLLFTGSQGEDLVYQEDTTHNVLSKRGFIPTTGEAWRLVATSLSLFPNLSATLLFFASSWHIVTSAQFIFSEGFVCGSISHIYSCCHQAQAFLDPTQHLSPQEERLGFLYL